MEKFAVFLIACAACLTAVVVQAAIPVGVVQTFSTAPAASDWSTMTNGGTGDTYLYVTGIDATGTGIQTNVAGAISFQLAQIAVDSAGAAARYISNGTLQRILTRPAGHAYQTVLATVQNTTGVNESAVRISYDLGSITPLPLSEDPGLAGLRVYYSLTGAADSWTLVPGLTSGTVGSLLAYVTLGSWAPNALLYVMFIDDNGAAAGDGSYTIDNFFVVTAEECPTITQQPANTTNLQGRTVSLSVVAAGPGLTYQWSKVGSGVLVDGPTGSGSMISGARTATLVIFNAQPGETGDYSVAVSNPLCNGPVTSAAAHLQINTDTEPPQFLRARGDADPFTFIVSFNEVICSDSACGYDALVYAFVWTVANADNPAEDLGVSSAVIAPEGTNVILTVQIARTPGALYRISVFNSGPGSGFYVTDLAGNAMPDRSFVITSPTATFQQGLNGYTGTQDAGIHSGAGIDTPDPTNPIIVVDGDDGGIRQALLRFDNIFGNGVGQIPLGANINSATLTFNQTDNGNPAHFHRMLVTWDQTTATWNLLGGGLTADGLEVATAIDAVTPGLNGVVGAITVDVTASVRAWAYGQPNHGWAILPTGADGWRWNASEIGATGPRLTVEYWAIIENWPPNITVQPPASTTVTEGSTVIVNVGVMTAGVTTFQWKKGGVDVPGQTNQTLRIVNVSPCDAGSYTLHVTNPSGSVTTTPAVLVLLVDITRPLLTRAVSASSTSIVLTFNKQMGATATASSNYTLSGGATVSAAALSNGPNNATVTLTTSARLTTTTLTITGVTDNRRGCTGLDGNPINPNPTVVDITAIDIAAGAEWNSSWLYNTNNLDGTPTWKDVGFIPGADWLTGNALFGTEPDAGIIALFPTPIATVIPPSNTVYFRKTVTLPELAAGAQYLLDHLIDDGAVFYWDGVEFGRYNMTNGAVVYATKAAGAIEASHQSIALPASANAGGTHTLAIEVHQGGSTTSSDMLFAAQIVAVPTAAPLLSISHTGATNVVRWTADSRWRLVRAPVVTGPYAVVGGKPFHSFIVPPAANTNNAFFQLQHNPNP